MESTAARCSPRSSGAGCAGGAAGATSPRASAVRSVADVPTSDSRARGPLASAASSATSFAARAGGAASSARPASVRPSGRGSRGARRDGWQYGGQCRRECLAERMAVVARGPAQAREQLGVDQRCVVEPCPDFAQRAGVAGELAAAEHQAGERAASERHAHARSGRVIRDRAARLRQVVEGARQRHRQRHLDGQHRVAEPARAGRFPPRLPLSRDSSE